ncbi:MAG TPA: SusC/RagA family TonB-linked outer membrane protein, partial [Gemmatimonadaceae bacterium]|nr:SusC/RagA family TonB-linked outer membrane protein [Gemmatimonadaceae bacterium]
MSRGLLLFAALSSALPVTETVAQRVITFAGTRSSIERPAAAPRSSPLELPARLTTRDVSLAEGLEQLHARSGVSLAFSPSFVPVDHRVTCYCADVTVGRALAVMLAGLPLESTAIDGDLVLIAPRAPTASGAPVEPGAVTAAQISGVVTNAATQQPIPGVQVVIQGTTLGAMTRDDGRYVIPNVPDGTHRIRTQRIGFSSDSRTVTVAAQALTVDFALTQVLVSLDEVVVTGTPGGTQRRAIGNVVTSVAADSVLAKAPVGNVNQLIGSRTTGVMMLPGTGQVGTGSSVRIRGASSLSLSAEPIIYIDGVRMDSDASRGPGQRGGANVSRLNDINPADIESMEIIKGPAAATLYGTEASNGVIQIITKKGSSGTPVFDFTSRTGLNWLWNPEGRAGMRYMPDPAKPNPQSVADLIGFNAYENERVNGDGPIFGYGLMQGYSLSVRGGTDAVRYFASASGNDDVGVVDWNWDKKIGLRGNMDVRLSDQLNLTLGTAYIEGQTRLAQGSINTDPFSNLVWSNPRFLADGRRGFTAAPPGEWGEVESRSDNDRTTASIELKYQPVEWTTHRLVAGLDMNSEVGSTLYPQQPELANHFYGALGLGSKEVSRGARRFVTLDYSGSAKFDWRNYVFTPSVGFQYYRSRSSFINSSGANFPAVPVTTVSGGAVRDGGETFVENSTAGVYFQQQVGWNNRVFLTGAVRADANSAFGEEFKAAYYPKLSGAWVVHEEPFFTIGWVDQLRLRGAWGAAGQQPATFAAARLYDPVVGYGDQPALSPTAYGNPQLKPERGEELELGFDAGFLNGRLNVEYTRYQRSVKDAIVNRPLSPSSGFTGSQIVNIGLLKAWGNELGVTARLVERRRVSWELSTQLSTMGNRIEELGGLDFIGAGTQAQHREGYSPADLFMRRILSAEFNAAGAVVNAMCDGGTGPLGLDPGGAAVPCSEAHQVWLGRTQPTWNFGVGNTVTLFGNVTLYARIDGNGGHKQVNTEIRATHNQSTTEGVLLKNNPILAATRIIENDRTGVYDAGFLRLREVSASYDLPNQFVGRFGASRGSVSLGMRNVAMLWTAQHGWSTPRDGHVRESLANMIVWDP